MQYLCTHIVAKATIHVVEQCLKPGSSGLLCFFFVPSFVSGKTIKKPQKWGFRVQNRVLILQILDFQGLLRRERDSNPRYLSVRRFSRPVHSTTLPSLHRVFEIAVLAVKKVNHLKASLHCGERGIRTPGTSQYAGFQDRCIRPLCHLSNRGNAIDVALQSQ